MQTPKLFNESQENNLEKLYSFCELYKAIVLNYESDNFGAVGCFLADISLIKEMLSDLENSDFKEGSVNAKAKIDELSNIHKYFWNNIAPIALLLNVQIEDFRKLLTSEQIDSAKRIIKKRMEKYPAFEKNDKDENTQNNRYDRFKKKIVFKK